MHKVVILIEPVEDAQVFEAAWPEFLHQVESMPGLRRETSCRVEMFLYGHPCAQIHELYFDSLSDAQQALASPQGRAAGRLIQAMTGGRMSLFLADHKEDDIENILKFRQGSTQDQAGSA